MNTRSLFLQHVKRISNTAGLHINKGRRLALLWDAGKKIPWMASAASAAANVNAATRPY